MSDRRFIFPTYLIRARHSTLGMLAAVIIQNYYAVHSVINGEEVEF